MNRAWSCVNGRFRFFPAAAARLMSHGPYQPDLPIFGRTGVGV